MRAALVLRVAEILQKRQTLKRFTQAHIVAEDAAARARGVLRGEPRDAFALVRPQTRVEVVPFFRLVQRQFRRRVVRVLDLSLALRVRERGEPVHLLLRDLRSDHDAHRVLPGALHEIRASRRVRGLRKERHEPVPQPHDENRLAFLRLQALHLHLEVRREPHFVVRRAVRVLGVRFITRSSLRGRARRGDEPRRF